MLTDWPQLCRRETGGFPVVVVLSAGEWYHQEKRSVQQLHADVEDLSAAVIEADAAAQEVGASLAVARRSWRRV